jgi:glycosidase
VYYGDEAGMEGGADPFNRVCYPWGHEDSDLLDWYKHLSLIRRENSCFKDGVYQLVEARDGLFAFTRGSEDQRILIAVNVSDNDRNVTAPEFNFNLLKNEHTDLLTVEAGKTGIFKIS